jgi:hypothetical protein
MGIDHCEKSLRSLVETLRAAADSIPYSANSGVQVSA